MTDETIAKLIEAEGGPPPSEELTAASVDPQLAETIEAELPGHEYRFFSADSGRGASGYAVALEVLSIVADIGGTVAFAAGTIALVRRLYDALREKLGRRPCVSLGSATFLAAAQLADRLGNTDFRLHGAGDTRTQPHDYSYTGNDCFYVIFERGSELFFHAVDGYGEVTFLGTAQMPQLYG